MNQLTNSQRIEQLQSAANHIFQVEESYAWNAEDNGDIRHDGYRIRIAIGNLIQRMQDMEKKESS